MESNDNIGDTIPLYDEVKKNIYKLYQELKQSSTIVLTTNGMGYRTAYLVFIEKYLNFFSEVNRSAKLNKITKNKSEYLKRGYDAVINNKLMSKKQISNIVMFSGELVEGLGITKIESRSQESWAM